MVKQLVSQLVLLQQESQQAMVVARPIFEQSQQLVALPPKLVKLLMLVVELLLELILGSIKFSFIASLIALGSDWQQWHQPIMISKHQIVHLRRGSKSFEELLPLSLGP